MMFDKKKKQKIEKQKRNNLRMLPQLLQQPFTLLRDPAVTKVNISDMNMLKIITNIHINYIVFSYIEALNKANKINDTCSKVMNTITVQNIKVGIIGGGVMGRLILNSLLVLQKEGLNPANISISTRQVQHFEYYTTHFKVNVEFNNDKLAQQSDILIVTVPATIDNWVITDLKQPLSKRIKRTANSTTANSSMVATTTQLNINNKDKNNNNSISNTTVIAGNINTTSMSSVPVSNIATKTVTTIPPSNIKNTLNPLVYITTSNMTESKLTKLFDFPVLIPIIRGENIDALNQIAVKLNEFKEKDELNQIEEIEKMLKIRILNKREVNKQMFNFVFENYIYVEDRQIKSTKFTPYNDKQKKSSKTLNINEKIGEREKTEKQKQRIERIGQSIQNSLNGTSYIDSAMNINNNIQQVVKGMVDEILNQHENTEQTFLMRCRKWRMAYNNYIA